MIRYLPRNLPRNLRPALALVTMLFFLLPLAPTQASASGTNVPYALPVLVPPLRTSPPIDPDAPYTPTVLSLIAQLEPNGTLTAAQIANIAQILHGGDSPDCHNVGPVGRPVGLDGSGAPTGTTLVAPANAGDTNIQVESVAPYHAEQTIWIDATSEAEQATIASVGTPGAGGTSITLASGLTKAHAVGRPVYGKLTTPSISYLCWSDAQGIQPTAGPNAPVGQTLTTAPTEMLALAGTFDRKLANAYGQMVGREGRDLMVTGLFGPQTDLNRLPNWNRGHQTNGEDPYLANQMVAAQINGMQGVGLMAQTKHFAIYNGQNVEGVTSLQDQALHEMYLTPYEGGIVTAKAAGTMCSYQIWNDLSNFLPSNTSTVGYPAGVSSLGEGKASRFQGTSNPQTWRLDEAHYSCEQPLILTYVLHDLWKSVAMVGSDYPATPSTSAIFQGVDQEMPTRNGFFAGGEGGEDATGSTCGVNVANPSAASWDPLCALAGSVRLGGIPNNFQKSGRAGCPSGGCTLIAGVQTGNIPLSVLNQALARVLYQQERFGMLGCEPVITALCTNPGGIGNDRSGNAKLPLGPASNASPLTDLGTKNGDAALAELMAEEGGVLFKNDNRAGETIPALPITADDLANDNRILVTGPGAEYLIASPSREAALGFPDRIAINPLVQLRALSENANAFEYVPALSPTGEPVPPASLYTPSDEHGLLRIEGPSSPTTDAVIDFTAVNGNQLASPGTRYTWKGCLYVAAGGDNYLVRFQSTPGSVVTFNLSTTANTSAESCAAAWATLGAALPTPRTLRYAATFYHGQFQGSVVVNPTNAGYTDGGLTNLMFEAGNLTPAQGTYYPLWFSNTTPTTGLASFRLAYSRANGDIADAAAAALGKRLAIVFVNDDGVYGAGNPSSVVQGLTAPYVNLIQAVAAANPNTIVVLNSAYADVVQPWIGNVKALLEMWNAGQEGSTGTARLLLGQANPSGHTAMTWPQNGTDTIWGYNQTVPLYPGDSTGIHPERMNGAGNNATNETEGIYTGYRFFDKQKITPQFEFGFGLSYTTFKYSGLTIMPKGKGYRVTFKVKNTGAMAGDAVPQLYVGSPKPRANGIQYAVRALAGFERISLQPKESKTVTLKVHARALSHWDEKAQGWVQDAGCRKIYVGPSSRILPLKGKACGASAK